MSLPKPKRDPQTVKDIIRLEGILSRLDGEIGVLSKALVQLEQRIEKVETLFAGPQTADVAEPQRPETE